MAKQTEWQYGQQAALARVAGVSKQLVSNIVRGRRRASAETAERLEDAARRLGIPLKRFDFLYPEDSTSPLICCGHG